MKFKLTLLAAALAVAACAPKSGPTTKLAGQFTEDAPSFVGLTIKGVLDTTLLVTDNRFEAEVPTDVTTMATLVAGTTSVTFVADGSTIALKQSIDENNILTVFPSVREIRKLCYGVKSIAIEYEGGRILDTFPSDGLSAAINQQYQILMSVSER